MSKVALARIPALTFYKDSQTLSRRGNPFPQLVCVGKPCKLFTPDAVRCVNAGGQGTDVDWKCEADLPEALRFGRVEVSCEGWSGPGDPDVLKGSCSLEYRLVKVPDALRKDGDVHRVPSRFSRWMQDAYDDPAATVFMIIWIAFLLFIVYSFIKSCFGHSASNPRARPQNRRRPSGPGGPGSGWFPGTHPHDNDPPPPYSNPPYSKQNQNTQPPASNNTTEGWRPGFWTGAALGGLGTYMMNNRREQQERTQPAGVYDWENERMGRAYQPPSGSGVFSSARRPMHNSNDRGEGSSNLGQMRRSTGFGGSNVR